VTGRDHPGPVLALPRCGHGDGSRPRPRTPPAIARLGLESLPAAEGGLPSPPPDRAGRPSPRLQGATAHCGGALPSAVAGGFAADCPLHGLHQARRRCRAPSGERGGLMERPTGPVTVRWATSSASCRQGLREQPAGYPLTAADDVAERRPPPMARCRHRTRLQRQIKKERPGGSRRETTTTRRCGRGVC
jgi:hypothetical protein